MVREVYRAYRLSKCPHCLSISVSKAYQQQQSSGAKCCALWQICNWLHFCIYFGLIYCDDVIIKCCLNAVIQLWFRKAQKLPNSTDIVFSGLFFLNSCWSLRMGLCIIIVRLLSIGLSTIDLGSWWLYWISREQLTGKKEQTTVFFFFGGGGGVSWEEPDSIVEPILLLARLLQ